MNSNARISRRAVVMVSPARSVSQRLALLHARSSRPRRSARRSRSSPIRPGSGHHAPTNIYPDSDVIVIDPSFNGLRIGNSGTHRLATGFTWAEGPAWSSEGQYLVFSDVIGNT